MENQYEYDEFITTYLRSLNRDTIYKLYLNIFKNIDILNTSNFFKEEEVIELDLLESELREIVTLHEEMVNDDIINLLVHKLIEFVIRGLYKQGITLSNDVKLSQLDKVLETIVIITNIDSSLTDEILEPLDSDENDVTDAFITYLNTYTDLTLTQAHEVVEYIGYSFKEKIKDYLERRKMSKPDTSDFNYLVKLINLDNNYAKTFIVKDFITDGYEEVILEYNLDDMYNNITKHNKVIIKIAYEIVATLFLSSDSRITLEDSLEQINIEALGLDPLSERLLKESIEPLITQLEMRL